MSETNSQEVKSCNINYNLFKTFMKFSFALKIVLNYFFFKLHIIKRGGV